MQPGVRGTVTAVSGNTITVTSTNPRTKAATTYTIDATSATVTKSGAASSVSAIAVGDMVSAQGTLTGTNLVATKINDGMMQRAPGVFGTVASVNGNTITVTSKGFGQNATATTYTVDATNATVTKAGAASSVSAIAVGDTVMVQGTVSGTSVTATKINDGVMMMGKGGAGAGMPAITGNGEPVVAGTVTAINGNSVTITNKSSVTYTIDVTSAKITKQGVTSPTISNVSVGDQVVVQGTVNGNAVTATTLVDQGAAGGTSNGAPAHTGFLGAIGGFFSKLFGFF